MAYEMGDVDLADSLFRAAHHCVNYHPANRIMQDFYHHRLRSGLGVPAILGLTASPVVRAKPDQLRLISTTPVLVLLLLTMLAIERLRPISMRLLEHL